LQQTTLTHLCHCHLISKQQVQIQILILSSIIQLQNSISPFSGQLYPMHKSVLNSTLGHKNGLSKYVCCLCVTNFLFFWCKALCTNFFMCKSYAHKALCVNLVLYAKLKDNGPRQVMSQIRLHKGFYSIHIFDCQSCVLS
jgi:hypothetical protein